jgi:hypothetical protein
MQGLSPTARRAINAYGGEPLWRAATRAKAVVSAKGLAFTLKRRPAFERAVFVCDIYRPHCTLTPIGLRPGVSGQLIEQDVRLLDASAGVIAQRQSAATFFPFGRRTFWWDDLDMTWFACYAFWNYLTLPALLMNPEVAWTELAAGHLRATFPKHIPTHCTTQDFYFDASSGLLRRHDYVANVVAPIAHAANVVQCHSQHRGLIFPSQRRVTPIGFNRRALPGPTLVSILVHEFSLDDG